MKKIEREKRNLQQEKTFREERARTITAKITHKKTHMNNNKTHESKILTRLIKNPEKNPLESSEEALSILKRIPENPFILNNKVKSDQYLKNRKELIIKLSIILNKHIHYWLQKEMPKFYTSRSVV